MRNQMVDALGVLVYGYLIHCLERNISHRAVCFGHHIVFVPVVSRRGNHFIEILCRTSSTDLINARHTHILTHLH